MEGKSLKKYKVKLNNIEKIEELLQESYDQSCQSYNAIQEDIKKVANSTTIKDLDIDGKEKYGKIMANYFSLQQKAITQKFDIAKLMAEVVKHGGDVKGAVNDMNKASTTLDLAKLKDLAKNALSSANDTENYVTKG